MEYHERQLKEVYRSTVHLCDWLDQLGYIKDGQLIMDLGCGAGANLAYIAKRYPKCRFIGVELNPGHAKTAARTLGERGVKNATAEQGDWYNLDKKFNGAFDGIISFQTISWLPEFREPLSIVCRLNPTWQAHSSLFYDGYVGCTAETQTYDEEGNEKRKLFYNVYSLPVVARHLNTNGYVNFKSKKFEIDIDIPFNGQFQSYTEKTEDGRRIQISGPVLMPWYFIAATRGVT